MNKTKSILIALLCALFFGAGGLYAQNTLIFKNINVDNGLPQNTVLSVLQDRKGYLWVGTYDGLSRFNGLEFKVYKNDPLNNRSISNNKINKILKDKNARLWIGTAEGLNLFDPATDSFTRFKIKGQGLNYNVISVAEDKQGVIWAGTDKGLLYVEPQGHAFLAPVIKRSNIFEGKKTECLYFDADQNLWICSGTSIKIFNAASQKYLAMPAELRQNQKFVNTVIRSIIQDKERSFWIGTDSEGLFYFNPRTHVCLNYNQDNGLLSNTVRSICAMGNSVVWVGTKKGLNIINSKNGKTSTYINDPLNPNSISQNSIREIYRDNEQNIWIGTFHGGLNCVYNQFDNFYYLGLKKGGDNHLSYGIVNAICEDRRGDFWMGTDDGGLNHVDKALQQSQSYYQHNGPSRELLGNSIKSIALNTADTNKLWIGAGNGLAVFDKQEKTFRDTHILPKPTATGVIQNLVLLNDQNGLWIGTNYSGLYFLSKLGLLKHYPTIENRISALYKDGDNLWIGTTGSGLECINIRNNAVALYQSNFTKPYSLTSNEILCIYKDKKGRLWVGTDGGGLNYFDIKANRFYSLTEETGLANNTIHEILEDGNGYLWVSTNKGISSVKFKNLSKIQGNSGPAISNYSVEDGLQSSQFSNGAAAKSLGGSLLFGGISGVTAFNPARIRVNTVKPMVVFTDFLIFNKSVSFKTKGGILQKTIDETNEITLNYNQAFFSISFAALNYINPQKNQFAFKLDGFTENGWHFVKNQRMATYTNLDPGTYYFKVKAANNDGVWSSTPRVLKIIVLPPWWKTYYAYAGYVVLFIYLLYLFNLYSKKTERLKNELAFESLSHLKDQELARNQLSFFVNISHEIKTPLTMILAPLERLIEHEVGYNQVKHQLSLVQRNGNKLMRLVNQLLDKKKLEAGQMNLQVSESNIVDFIEEIILAFSGLSSAKNITIKLRKGNGQINLWFDDDKLEKVFYNLLSNAVKFTPDYGMIMVSVEEDIPNKQVLIAVEDNGFGISDKSRARIFTQYYHDDYNAKIEGTGLGLAFSKELVELHHGEIIVESREQTKQQNGFSRFTVKLPLGEDHFKDNDIGTQNAGEDVLFNNQHVDGTGKANLQQKKERILARELNKTFSILIVEDNEDVLNFLKEGFDHDFSVITASDGLSGLKLAHESIPDIIISDVMMPGLNGMELCSKLKTDINTSHIPIILLTARTQFIFKMEGFETGADEYITKPFSFSLLEVRVWNLIENRQNLRLRYQREIKLDPQNITINSLDEEFLNKLLHFIEANIDDPDLSVEQLIQEAAMGRSSFYKKIKSLTNQTGIEFIRTIRIKRAAQLLASGKLTVNEVAYRVGFLDVNYFRKCFKEHFGYTPKEHAVNHPNDL